MLNFHVDILDVFIVGIYANILCELAIQWLPLVAGCNFQQTVSNLMTLQVVQNLFTVIDDFVLC